MIPSLITSVTVPPNKPSKELLQAYSTILKVNPKLGEDYAHRLAKAILNTSKRYNLKPNKLTAILAQESKFKLDAVNKLSRDYGIGQINHKSIKAYNINKNQLLTDLEYSVDMSGMILADFKRMYGKREKNYYSRYNSSNPDTRLKYEQLVKRYYE